MLWFNHPKPVGSRKPVAVLVQQHRDQRNTLTLDTPHAASPILHNAGELALLPLEFSVRYTLSEYVSFMWQHAHHLIRRRRIQAPASWYMLVKSTWASAFHFVMQGRSRHTYEFTVDRHGIVRTGPGGVTLIGWEDVVAIRSYSRGRLMMLKRGTLPIPARCLTREQSDSLAGYAAWVREAAHQAS
ncbi:MAG: YcxB family protein [Pseudomonadota bacterium]